MKIALALVMMLAPVPVLAQAYQCRLPDRVAPVPPVRPDGPVRRVPVASYTFAVSWSPEFCRVDRDPASIQCSGRSGRFGFVLHGLWPEAAAGPSPQWCALVPRPRPETVRASLCMTPAPRLIEHEWAKHGSCMAPTPEAYWATSRRLWQRYHWPDADALSRKAALSAGDLREAVMMANPGLPRGAIGIVLNRRGWLQELRLCHDRQFRPVPCRGGRFGPADATPLKIWRGL